MATLREFVVALGVEVDDSDLDEFEAQVKDLTQELANLGRMIRNIDREEVDFSETFINIEAATALFEQMEEQIEDVIQRLFVLQSVLNLSTAQFEGFAGGLFAAQKQVTNLDAVMNEFHQTQVDIDKSTGDIDRSLNIFTTTAKKTGRAASSTKNEMREFRNIIERLRRGVFDLHLGMTKLVIQFGLAAALGAAFVGVLGVGTFLAADFAAGLQSQANALGLNIQKFQRLNAVMTSSGIKMGKTGELLGRLTDKTNEAAQGTGSAAEAFNELNLDAQRLNQMAVDQQLKEIAGAFGQVENATRRMTTAQKLFTQSRAPKMLNLLERIDRRGLSVSGVVERSFLSEEQLQKASEFRNQIFQLRMEFTAIGVELGLALIPAFKNIISSIREWIANNEVLIKQKLPEVLADTAKAIGAALAAGLEFALFLQETIGLVVAIHGVMLALAFIALVHLATGINTVINSLKDLREALTETTVEFQPAAKAVAAFVDEMEEGVGVSKRFAKRLGDIARNVGKVEGEFEGLEFEGMKDNDEPGPFWFLTKALALKGAGGSTRSLARIWAITKKLFSSKIVSGFVGGLAEVAAILGVILLVLQDVFVFFTGGDSFIGRINEWIEVNTRLKESLGSIFEAVGDIFGVIGDIIGFIVKLFVTINPLFLLFDLIEAFAPVILSFASALFFLIGAIFDLFTLDFEGFGEKISKAWNSIWTELLANLKSGFKEAFRDVGNFFINWWNFIITQAITMIRSFMDSVAGLVGLFSPSAEQAIKKSTTSVLTSLARGGTIGFFQRETASGTAQERGLGPQPSAIDPSKLETTGVSRQEVRQRVDITVVSPNPEEAGRKVKDELRKESYRTIKGGDS